MSSFAPSANAMHFGAASILLLGLAAYISSNSYSAVVTEFSLPATSQVTTSRLSQATFAQPRAVPSAMGVQSVRNANQFAAAVDSAAPSSSYPSLSQTAGLLAFPVILVGAIAAVVSQWKKRMAPEDTLALSSWTSVRDVSRREVLGAGALAMTTSIAMPTQAAAPDTKSVGAFLPPYGDTGLYLFVPSKTETPSIRAGTISPASPYSFALPGTWRRQTVSNAISGNYCQPKCGEPWTEVIFSGPEGRVQVIAGPLDKLTPKANAQLSDIGSPERLIYSVGPYITGTYIDEDSVISATSKTVNGDVYYLYELYADYGTLPPHGLAACTAKGDVLLLFIVNATDKQWSRAQDTLRAVVESFQSDSVGRK